MSGNWHAHYCSDIVALAIHSVQKAVTEQHSFSAYIWYPRFTILSGGGGGGGEAGDLGIQQVASSVNLFVQRTLILNCHRESVFSITSEKFLAFLTLAQPDMRLSWITCDAWYWRVNNSISFFIVKNTNASKFTSQKSRLKTSSDCELYIYIYIYIYNFFTADTLNYERAHATVSTEYMYYALLEA
jgi:hypothetical protein